MCYGGWSERGSKGPCLLVLTPLLNPFPERDLLEYGPWDLLEYGKGDGMAFEAHTALYTSLSCQQTHSPPTPWLPSCDRTFGKGHVTQTMAAPGSREQLPTGTEQKARTLSLPATGNEFHQQCNEPGRGATASQASR